MDSLHPRQNLDEARRVLARPSLYSADQVHNACELLISFGHRDDFVQANELRAAVSRGEVVPGVWWSKMNRRIRFLAIACLIVWVLVGLLNLYASAQAAGFIPGAAGSDLSFTTIERGPK